MKIKRLLLKSFLTAVLITVLICAYSFSGSAASKAPLIKTIKQSEKTCDSVSFSWTVEGSAVNYRVYRYDAQTKKYVKLKTVKTDSYKVRGLESGECYIYAVKPGYNEKGKTVFGKLKTVTCYTSLDKVTDIKQSKTTQTSHKLTWTAVKGADSYLIYYYKESTGTYTLLGTKDKNSCTVSKLQPTKTYKYIIRAISTASNGKVIRSAKSAVFYAYTTPATVTGLTTSNESTTGYHLQWNSVTGAQGYKIYRFDEVSGKFTEFKKVQGNSCTFRNLTPASSDVYKVCAYAKLAKKVRYSALSEPFTATTKPEAVKPFVIEDAEKNGKIKIGWSSTVTADGYLVYISENENGPYRLASQITDPDTCEYTAGSLLNGTPYYFKVKTYIITDNSYVYSANSAVIESQA